MNSFLHKIAIAISSLVFAATTYAASEKATFAGGCFWCMEPPFEKLPGVFAVTSGYTGGRKHNPTYQEVSAGTTGHAEAVEIIYDPAIVSYKRLLDVFWHNIDPTAVNSQFCDSGNQYRSAIFFHSAEQARMAKESKSTIGKNGRFSAPVATEIIEAGRFYPAEAYHQDYYRKNPLRYKYYRNGCGRDKRLKELWNDQAGQ